MQLDEVGGVYLVTGASDAHWIKPVERAEIFESGACHIVDLIKRHQEWWDRYILGDSSGRPMSSPATLNVTPVSDVRLCVQETVWRLRTVRLEPTGETVEFRAGRPVLGSTVALARAISTLADILGVPDTLALPRKAGAAEAPARTTVFRPERKPDRDIAGRSHPHEAVSQSRVQKPGLRTL
jgi:hypothetical protein